MKLNEYGLVLELWGAKVYTYKPYNEDSLYRPYNEDSLKSIVDRFIKEIEGSEDVWDIFIELMNNGETLLYATLVHSSPERLIQLNDVKERSNTRFSINEAREHLLKVFREKAEQIGPLK